MPITNFKVARMNSHITQWKLGQLTGINETRLSKYETGKKEMSDDDAEKIANVLKISSDKLKGTIDE